jgi:hypothetical protein
MKGGRFKRGLDTAKRSYAVLKADRSLVLYPVIAAIACLVVGVVLLGGGAVVFAEVNEIAGIAVWVLTFYVLTFIGIYCNVALAGAAAQALDGKRTTLADGWAAARPHRGVIAQWALVQVTVGVLLQAIQAVLSDSAIGRVIASIFTFVASAAWAIATFFVIPILALEGLGPKAAITRSARLVKERWGEGLVGSGAIGAVMIVFLLVPIILIVVGVQALIGGGSDSLGVALVAVGAALAIPVLVFGSTLQAIFRVVLFRFATEDRVVAGFERDQLEHAFRPRKSRGRGRAATI